MSIDTTININIDLLNRIKNASAVLNVSRSELVSFLVKKVMRKKKFPVKMCSRVRYQDRKNPIIWRRVHVYLFPDLYECCLDLRKVLKMSVSYVIAWSVSEYLEEIIEEFLGRDNKKSDNYRSSYIFIAGRYDGVDSFTIFRGVPPAKTLKNLLP